MNPVNNIFESIISKFEPISTDENTYKLYKDIVDECAKKIEHIRVWDSNLGDYVRKKMGIL